MPELGALAAAVAALLIIFAWSLIFSRALQALRPHVPGLFLPLFDALAGADAAVYNALRAWADSAVSPFTDLAGRAIAALDALSVNPLRFAQATYGALWRVFNVAIPGAIAQTEGTTRALWQDATGRIEGVYNAVEADLRDAGAAFRVGLSALYSDLHQVAAYAQQLFITAERDLAAGVARAESEAAAAVGQEVSRAEAVEAGIVGAVDADLVQLVGEANAALRGLQSYVGTVAQGIESNFHHLLDGERAFAVGLAEIEKQDLDALRSGREWQILTDLEEAGGQLLTQGLVDLLELERRALRSEIAAAREVQVKLGPLVRGLAASIRKAG